MYLLLFVIVFTESTCDELTILLCLKVHLTIEAILIVSYSAATAGMPRRLAAVEAPPTIFMGVTMSASYSCEVVVFSTKEGNRSIIIVHIPAPVALLSLLTHIPTLPLPTPVVPGITVYASDCIHSITLVACLLQWLIIFILIVSSVSHLHRSGIM